MTVRLVDESFSEETEQVRAMLASIAPPPEPPREVPVLPKPSPPTRSPIELVEMMGALARILGFRVQLLLAFLGAAGIGGYAVYRADTMSLIAAAMYDLLVLAPLIFVAYKRG